MSYPTSPLPREYRVTGTKPATFQPVQPQPQPKKASFFSPDNPTLFWITLAMHLGLISIEVYLAYKANWIKF